jgi:hypothetical protein
MFPQQHLRYKKCCISSLFSEKNPINLLHYSESINNISPKFTGAPANFLNPSIKDHHDLEFSMTLIFSD